MENEKVRISLKLKSCHLGQCHFDSSMMSDFFSSDEDLDYAHMGSLLSEYWTLKKNLVADADPEPECCRILFEAMRPHCFGMVSELCFLIGDSSLFSVCLVFGRRRWRRFHGLDD